MTNPLDQIEDAQQQRDLGKLGARIYQGARDEDLNQLGAMLVVAGFYLAAFRHNADLAGDSE